jgi:RNA-directed DNA polymerase
MTVITGAPVASKATWNSIEWNKAEYEVKRLQMRIAKAIRYKKYGKAKALQRLLTHSFYGKCLAVKRVSQNKARIVLVLMVSFGVLLAKR